MIVYDDILHMRIIGYFKTSVPGLSDSFHSNNVFLQIFIFFTEVCISSNRKV